VGIPFNVSFSPFTDFGFIRWRACLDAIDPLHEVGTACVQFSGTGARTTAVTIKQNPGAGKIILLADTEGAPYIVSVFPELFGGPQKLNQYIQVIFSKPMDITSFRFEDGASYTGGPLNFPYYLESVHNVDTLWTDYLKTNSTYPEEWDRFIFFNFVKVVMVGGYKLSGNIGGCCNTYSIPNWEAPSLFTGAIEKVIVAFPSGIYDGTSI
jgi:hypothetical protein